MKKWMLILCVTGILGSCDIRNSNKHLGLNVNSNPHFSDTTSVIVLDSTYDFGKITDGEKVVYNYRFRNTGNKPLVISSAVASCGCTVPEKPEEPIKPGETGILKVVFNSEGKVGPAHKEIRVVSNAFPPFPVLLIKGIVENKK
jgi:hypothetical protein